MQKIIVTSVAIWLASCSGQSTNDGAIRKTPDSELTQTKELLMAQAAPATRALAVCGASYGKAVYVDPDDKKWVPDQISKGRFAFVESPQGDVDYIFLDATGRVTSARSDGGEIRRIYGSGTDGTFTVAYPETGVVETYNFTSDLEGGKIVLWTSNKPVTILPAKVAAFVANCITG
jgi:hypothetical protein